MRCVGIRVARMDVVNPRRERSLGSHLILESVNPVLYGQGFGCGLRDDEVLCIRPVNREPRLAVEPPGCPAPGVQSARTPPDRSSPAYAVRQRLLDVCATLQLAIIMEATDAKVRISSSPMPVVNMA